MLALTEDIARDHRVPEGAAVVQPDLCGNCTRRLYLKKDGLRICPGCSSAFEVRAQVWICLDCGTARKWGEGRPEETKGFFLKCARCCLVTEHEYSHIGQGLVCSSA